MKQPVLLLNRFFPYFTTRSKIKYKTKKQTQKHIHVKFEP